MSIFAANAAAFFQASGASLALETTMQNILTPNGTDSKPTLLAELGIPTDIPTAATLERLEQLRGTQRKNPPHYHPLLAPHNANSELVPIRMNSSFIMASSKDDNGMKKDPISDAIQRIGQKLESESKEEITDEDIQTLLIELKNGSHEAANILINGTKHRKMYPKFVTARNIDSIFNIAENALATNALVIAELCLKVYEAALNSRVFRQRYSYYPRVDEEGNRVPLDRKWIEAVQGERFVSLLEKALAKDIATAYKLYGLYFVPFVEKEPRLLRQKALESALALFKKTRNLDFAYAILYLSSWSEPYGEPTTIPYEVVKETAAMTGLGKQGDISAYFQELLDGQNYGYLHAVRIDRKIIDILTEKIEKRSIDAMGVMDCILEGCGTKHEQVRKDYMDFFRQLLTDRDLHALRAAAQEGYLQAQIAIQTLIGVNIFTDHSKTLLYPQYIPEEEVFYSDILDFLWKRRHSDEEVLSHYTPFNADEEPILAVGSLFEIAAQQKPEIFKHASQKFIQNIRGYFELLPSSILPGGKLFREDPTFWITFVKPIRLLMQNEETDEETKRFFNTVVVWIEGKKDERLEGFRSFLDAVGSIVTDSSYRSDLEERIAKEEALKILGLLEGASLEEISRAMWRARMETSNLVELERIDKAFRFLAGDGSEGDKED